MDLLKNLYKRIYNNGKVYLYKDRLSSKPQLICLLRVRNEELILQDTLNHLALFCDAIICYDDDSIDNTFNILEKHEKVIAIIRNFNWLSSPEDRIKCETLHRLALLNLAKRFQPEWIFCCDADERYVGNIREFINSKEACSIDVVRVSLFDAYITADDKDAYKKGMPLLNFRKCFGPERRDIIMLWRANFEDIIFVGTDSREPIYGSGRKCVTRFYCQHYGKSLSIEHWEETCNYYINHFPYKPYGEKWERRKGKAVHTESDFGLPLYQWGKLLFENACTLWEENK